MYARGFLIVFILSGFSFSKEKFKESNPPGTVRVNDTLFVDKTEVANIHWREYLYFLEKHENDETKLRKALPDTSVWDINGLSNSLSEYYMRHPGYNYYPVVGVSYEQVIEFCKWRTFVVNLGNYVDENKFNFEEHLEDTFPIKIIYRLPTEKEWEMVAAGKFETTKYPYGFDSTYRKWRGKYHKIFNAEYPGEVIVDSLGYRKFYTAEVKAYYPNTSGCYNIIGNVAEIISEKGIAKGGGFEHSIDSCKIPLRQQYNKPEKWLGFRCVAVKVK
jgi:formylglycine-generating enzyme required for sulfatase activity